MSPPNSSNPTKTSNETAMYKNPVIYQDLPDMDIIRLGETYYMSCSSFHYSPGAPILRSQNLTDWTFIGHSVPQLSSFGARFRLDGKHTGSWSKGIWASSLRYRKSDGLFYWYGAIQGTERTYVFTAKDPGETWKERGCVDRFYYDLGLFIDDDDAMYIAYGQQTIYVVRLSEDGLREVECREVHTSNEHLEGARMYKIKGVYYIFLTRPYSGQYMLKSTPGPFGPYECQRMIGEIASPIPGSGHPHQGALIDTPDGRWYYMAFIDAYPAGRVPVLAPVTFNDQGWPEVELDDSKPEGGWKLEYPLVNGQKDTSPTSTCFRPHKFDGGLEKCMEWNHDPDNTTWQIQDGKIVLSTSTITQHLHLASNTLAHRVIGPRSVATFCIDVSKMKEGDKAGACMLKNLSAYIGVHKTSSGTRLTYVDGLESAPRDVAIGRLNGHPIALDWLVKSDGVVRAQTDMLQDRAWLRIKADVTAAFSHGYEKCERNTAFEYSFDGNDFKQFGPAFTITNSYMGFMSYRFAVFNFATVALGGQISVESLDIRSW